MLRIVLYPHPALRFVSVPVQRIDDTLRAQVASMFDLMYASKGIGLAANQVGLPYQFFVLNLTADPTLKDQEEVFINPRIIKRHSSCVEEEGCLSFPGLYAPVQRAKRIRVQYYDLLGHEHTRDAEDLFSRAVQHETDHVLGRLFIDYLTADVLKSVTPKIREFEQAFREQQREGSLASDDDLRMMLERLSKPAETFPT